MSEIKKQWYVVRAIGGKEAKVKEYIEAEIRHNHLEDYISQVLIPTEKVYTIRNGKKVSKEKVSYPGYVLVEAAFVGPDSDYNSQYSQCAGFLRRHQRGQPQDERHAPASAGGRAHPGPCR